MSAGLLGYGVYVPFWRLDRSAIGAALGAPAGKGTRAVASYDEDATSMGVEAGRVALAGGAVPDAVYFATTAPPYVDKTNATAIAAGLGLPRSTAAYDMTGSVRSAVGAFRAAADAAAAGRTALAVLADVRTGLPGSVDERDGGDAAVALLFGPGDVVAEEVAFASMSAEFLDRWRLPGAPGSRVWEERFGEAEYVPLALDAFNDCLKQAGLTPGDVDHLVVTGPHHRAVARATATTGVRDGVVVPSPADTIGYTGAAHAGLLLAIACERAEPGDLVCVLSVADGADALLLRTTTAVEAARAAGTTVADRLAPGRSDLAYATYLTWRELLYREPPRRPDPTGPAAPPSARNETWKFGFVGSRCECGMRHLPPQRVCVRCHAVDRMRPERVADVRGTIVTYTVDRLAYSMSPPVVVAVIDLDGGGRTQCELTDVDPDAVTTGDRVELTFRKLFTAGGVHNYFWKARPVRFGEGEG